MTGALTAAEKSSERWHREHADWFDSDGRRYLIEGRSDEAGEYSVMLGYGYLAMQVQLAVDPDYDDYPPEERKEARAAIRKLVRRRLTHFQRFADVIGHVAGWDGAWDRDE